MKYIIGIDTFDDHALCVMVMTETGEVVLCESHKDESEFNSRILEIEKQYNCVPIKGHNSIKTPIIERKYATIPSIEDAFLKKYGEGWLKDKFRGYFLNTPSGREEIFGAIDWKLVKEIKNFAG